MKNEVTSILQAPFIPDQIKQRKGLWGRTLDYIEGHSVIQRLNHAFESDWSFEITDHSILEEEVIAIGRLTVGEIVKMQFGSNKITRDSESGKALSLGDDLKAASTDSLKKCASLLGIGLHLYGDVSGTRTPQKKSERSKLASKPAFAQTVAKTDSNPQKMPIRSETPTKTANPGAYPRTKPEAPKPIRSQGNGGNSSSSQGGNGESLITAKQHRFCLSLARKQNLNADSLHRYISTVFHNKTIEQLSMREASQLIDSLQA